jgi:pentatricopeptide repeat protein
VVLCWKVAVQDLNLTPDEGLCISVLHTAARHGIPDLATDALRVLKLIGVPWEEHLFSPLIEAFCHADRVKEALLTLDIMRTSGIEPTVETAYPLLDIAQKDPDTIDSIWAIIDDLHKEVKRVDITALNALTLASVVLGDLQRAVGAYKSFSDYGVKPNLITFNILLRGCIMAAHRELGSLLLADMKEAKIKPNRETYQKFISLCLTQDTYEDAFFYLEEMKAAHHVVPSSVYISIIRKCLSAGDTRYTVAAEEMRHTGYSIPLDLMQEIKEATYQAEEPHDDHPPSAGSQPVVLDGAAQKFIETGGLVGTEELGKAPSAYTHE